MHEYLLDREQWVAAPPIEEVFAFFQQRGQTWSSSRPPGSSSRSSRQSQSLWSSAAHRISHPLALCTTATGSLRFVEWSPPNARSSTSSCAAQYSSGTTTHTFSAERGGTTIRDRIRYALTVGFIRSHRQSACPCAATLARIFDLSPPRKSRRAVSAIEKIQLNRN